MSTQPTSLLQAIYRKRAEKLARRTETAAARQTIGMFTIIELSGQRLALPMGEVGEIVEAPPIARLPNLPDWLPGVVQLRGELLCLVDITRLYGMAPARALRLIAVLRGEPGELGLLVDDVLGFREIVEEELATGATDPAAGSPLPSRGTTRDLVTIFEPHVLFADVRIIVNRAHPSVHMISNRSVTREAIEVRP